MNPDPVFTLAGEVLKHLDAHREAGHQVPQRAYESVSARADEWLTRESEAAGEEHGT